VKKIYFVTTNTGKVASLMQRIEPDKFEIVARPVNIPEIQADFAKDIVYEKAKVAYSILKKPLLVHDSSFHIPALNNFPGVYAKYMNETIGIDGILKLMRRVDDRSCYFQGALAFADKNEIRVFASKTRMGTIATKVHTFDHPRAWSALWKIYIPFGCTKTMSAFSDEELQVVRNKKRKNEFQKFAQWINAKDF
jgi:XTP/dITP diphosphohydrolase